MLRRKKCLVHHVSYRLPLHEVLGWTDCAGLQNARYSLKLVNVYVVMAMIRSVGFIANALYVRIYYMRIGVMENILTFDKVTKSFNDVTALRSLSFNIPENTVVGLIGANGAGKTTIMRLIIRYLMPNSGSIYFRHLPIHSVSSQSFPLAYIPDTPIYYEELTVMEHLFFIGTMYNSKSKIESLINTLELDDHISKVPAMLSKGNKQKLSIACALLRDYDLLIADEPFTGLDPKQIKAFKNLILENKAQGKTILLSTHLLDVIESLCDEFIMIDHGSLLTSGTLEQIISGNELCSTLEDLYLYLSVSNIDSDASAIKERARSC